MSSFYNNYIGEEVDLSKEVQFGWKNKGYTTCAPTHTDTHPHPPTHTHTHTHTLKLTHTITIVVNHTLLYT